MKLPIRIVVEGALAIALAFVLNRFPLWQMPAGGKVSLEMLPIIVFAVRRGWLPGLIAGALWGGLDFMVEPFIVHPGQVALDYGIAFAAMGAAAGLFAPWASALARNGRTAGLGGVAALAAVAGGGARFAAHFASGWIFFWADAVKAGQPAWLYSLLYNGAYMVPTIVMTALAAAVLVPVLARAVPVVATADQTA